jgi:signal peptidase II
MNGMDTETQSRSAAPETAADPSSAPEARESPRTGGFWRWAALLGSAAFVLALDQMAKALVMRDLVPGQSVVPFPLLSDYFAITLSYNTGAAFSMLPQAGDLFLMVALAMIVGILLFYRRMPAGRWVERVALGMLLGGACGNALDRIRFGHVIDWVHLQLPGVISNVSNFADHAIVIGMGLLVLRQWGVGSPKPPPAAPDSVADSSSG